MTVTFFNKGIIIPAALTTFGLSAKLEGSIGFFGTGLKYAISIILRTGHEISIQCGKTSYSFTLEKQTHRDQEFSIPMMQTIICDANNDAIFEKTEAMPFTTNLGKTWDLWQAYRELFCNAMDEKGGAELGRDHCADDETCIRVSGAEFEAIHNNRFGEVLMPGWGTEPIGNWGGVQIFQGKSDYLYYKGIRVYKLLKPSLFTYNVVDSISLTEDRTLSYPYEYRRRVERAVMNCCSNTDILRTIYSVNPEDDVFEAEFDFESASPGTDSVVILKSMAKSKVPMARAVFMKARHLLMGDFLGTDDMMNAIEVKQMEKAVKFLKKMGMDIGEYPILFFATLGDGVLGQAIEGKILLSRAAFVGGTKMLAGTIMEEYLHLKYHFYDCTRQFQNHLIDLVISTEELRQKKPL